MACKSKLVNEIYIRENVIKPFTDRIGVSDVYNIYNHSSTHKISHIFEKNLIYSKIFIFFFVILMAIAFVSVNKTVPTYAKNPEAEAEKIGLSFLEMSLETILFSGCFVMVYLILCLFRMPRSQYSFLEVMKPIGIISAFMFIFFAILNISFEYSGFSKASLPKIKEISSHTEVYKIKSTDYKINMHDNSVTLSMPDINTIDEGQYFLISTLDKTPIRISYIFSVAELKLELGPEMVLESCVKIQKTGIFWTVTNEPYSLMYRGYDMLYTFLFPENVHNESGYDKFVNNIILSTKFALIFIAVTPLIIMLMCSIVNTLFSISKTVSHLAGCTMFENFSIYPIYTIFGINKLTGPLSGLATGSMFILESVLFGILCTIPVFLMIKNRDPENEFLDEETRHILLASFFHMFLIHLIFQTSGFYEYTFDRNLCEG